jgi:hypothetical protein
MQSWIVAGLGLAAFICGLLAAYLWRRSTLMPIEPEGFEPVVPELRQIWWKIAERNASEQSAIFNRQAAWWTAAAALFCFAGVAVGAWPISN